MTILRLRRIEALFTTNPPSMEDTDDELFAEAVPFFQTMFHRANDKGKWTEQEKDGWRSKKSGKGVVGKGI